MNNSPFNDQGDGAFRAKTLHETPTEMNYGGVTSFLRRRYSRDLSEADIAVLGIPYDGATTSRPGSRYGPRAIRAASSDLAELNPFATDDNPLLNRNIIDYGDCFLDPGYQARVAPSIRACADKIINSDTHLISMGGDHFISYPLLQAHAQKYGPLALLQFDAHCDTWTDDGTTVNHGTMFSRAVKEGLILTQNSIQVGIRTRGDHDHGIQQLGAQWIHENGVSATIEAIKSRVGSQPCYLSFDIDCLDPAFAPGTGTPVCGGLSSWQAIAIIRGIAACKYVGMDVVEVCPAYDRAEITALAAASIIQEYLCFPLA